MHLQVRGASRQTADIDANRNAFRVLMHLQVRGASRPVRGRAPPGDRGLVLMHLQVRGASRQDRAGQARPLRDRRLNAPTGAWCFPTGGEDMIYVYIIGLNAPTGAWCFPTFP